MGGRRLAPPLGLGWTRRGEMGDNGDGKCERVVHEEMDFGVVLAVAGRDGWDTGTQGRWETGSLG